MSERKYQLEQEIIHGTNKGKRSLCGREDVLMTHAEAIHFRDMHTSERTKTMNREECLKIISEARAKGERPNLSRANLSDANLRRANLSDADLSDANLRRANLSDADLSGADLSGADLSGADLSRASLSGANLSRADLIGANLSGAMGADLALAMASHLPSHGQITGWKKLAGGLIAKLIIPESAKRSHGASRKCRASSAKVEAIYDSLGGGVIEGVSIRSSDFVYRVGETVEPEEPFCEDRWSECASGIHFFITRKEAENYEY